MNLFAASQNGPSRADVERYCVLQAIAEGCSCSELTARLGLSPSLADVVHTTVHDLQAIGLVEDLDTRITLTPKGEDWKRQITAQHGQN
jgi:DNA-binding IclR family transcriptional regulator